MPRLKKQKMVYHPPLFNSYKPTGVRRGILQQLTLGLDEYEAIRLADFEGMDHAEAAEEMEISRSTFSRLIERARHKMALFLIEGKELLVDGGNIHFRQNLIRCNDCNHIFNIRIESAVKYCPQCQSENLVNLARGFGHGRCCTPRRNRGSNP